MTKTLLLIPAALLLACTFAAAQTDSGAIRVLVEDTSSAAVSGATVKVTNVATGVVLSRSSESDGYATFSPIVHGNYMVDVEKTGFQKTHVTDLALDVDEHKLVRVSLPVASVSTSVDVSASANIVQSEQGSLGQVIQGEVGGGPSFGGPPVRAAGAARAGRDGQHAGRQHHARRGLVRGEWKLPDPE